MLREGLRNQAVHRLPGVTTLAISERISGRSILPFLRDSEIDADLLCLRKPCVTELVALAALPQLSMPLSFRDGHLQGSRVSRLAMAAAGQS